MGRLSQCESGKNVAMGYLSQCESGKHVAVGPLSQCESGKHVTLGPLSQCESGRLVAVGPLSQCESGKHVAVGLHHFAAERAEWCLMSWHTSLEVHWETKIARLQKCEEGRHTSYSFGVLFILFFLQG